jgi:hypothetical protein
MNESISNARLHALIEKLTDERAPANPDPTESTSAVAETEAANEESRDILGANSLFATPRATCTDAAIDPALAGMHRNLRLPTPQAMVMECKIQQNQC